MRGRCVLIRRVGGGVDVNYQRIVVEERVGDVPYRSWVRRTRLLTGEGVEAWKDFIVVHIPAGVVVAVGDGIEVRGEELRITGVRPYLGHTQLDCEGL